MIPLRDDNPTRATPVLTISLIAANTLVFLYQAMLPPQAESMFVSAFGAIPGVVTGTLHLRSDLAVIPAPMTLLTSMFLHGSLMHLVGNLLYLWIFGNNIEEAMGRIRFLLFYILCGLGAAAAHIFSNVDSDLPIIGASGAISGILGAYILLYPRAQVLTLVPLGFFVRLMYIPASIVLGFWFVLQVFSGTFSDTAGRGIAWWAHVGGFVFGMLLVGLFKRRDVRFFNRPIYHASRFRE